MIRTNELDPSGAEPQALLEAADFSDARVLEIGCGNGRLSFRYAEESRAVVGVDPETKDLVAALAARPRHLAGRLTFVPAGAEELPFRDGSFDIAIFAWSL